MTDPRDAGAGPLPAAHTYADDEALPVRPLVEFFWTYRWVFGRAILAAFVLCSLLLVVLALVLPSEKMGSIRVRFLFEGAADGRYPNGTAFNPAEVVATPVLAEVYRANELERYVKLDAFMQSMAVLRSSFEEDQLAAAYSARLADTKLGAVDRAKLEDEYQKKRQAIKDPVYAVNIRLSERLKTMPKALVEKVLNDILATWARQADELKGATRFYVPVFSRDVLRPEILDKEYLLTADALRVQARRAAVVVQQLMALPGTVTIRSQKEKISLADVGIALDEILRIQIEPALYLIQERGIAHDPRAMVQYLHGHTVELRLDRDAARARMQTLQDALQGYVTTRGTRAREGSTAGAGAAVRQMPGADAQASIPQISETFLDRIIEMSTMAGDVNYRQDLTNRVIAEGQALAELERSTTYYEQLEKTVGTSQGRATEADEQAVRQRLRKAFDELNVAIGRLLDLYDEVSEQRLNPTLVLYSISEPFASKSGYALTLGTAALLMTLSILVALVAAVVGCAMHRGRARPFEMARAR